MSDSSFLQPEEWPFSRIAGYGVLNACPLGGGLSNRCWRLVLHSSSSSDLQAVWRPVSAASQAFGVDRQQEYQLLSAIHPCPFAPHPIAKTPDGILVEWIEGAVCTHSPSPATLMALQANIHRLPIPGWRLAVRQRAERYLAAISPQDKGKDLVSVCSHFFSHIPQSGFPDTCCHHDLGFYNLIQRPGGELAVIDWEYAAAGDPMLDLALTVQANQLDVTIAAQHYCRYLGADPELVSEAVQQWLPWCDFLAMLWYYAGANLWQDETYRIEAKALLAKLAVA